MIKLPITVPEPHRLFLERIEQLKSDNRIMGVAVGGSLLDDLMDEFSDLDLVIAVDPTQYSSVMNERYDIVASLGHLLSGFTGEHVGEPHVFICLYYAGLSLVMMQSNAYMLLGRVLTFIVLFV